MDAARYLCQCLIWIAVLCPSIWAEWGAVTVHDDGCTGLNEGTGTVSGDPHRLELNTSDNSNILDATGTIECQSIDFDMINGIDVSNKWEKVDQEIQGKPSGDSAGLTWAFPYSWTWDDRQFIAANAHEAGKEFGVADGAGTFEILIYDSIESASPVDSIEVFDVVGLTDQEALNCPVDIRWNVLGNPDQQDYPLPFTMGVSLSATSLYDFVTVEGRNPSYYLDSGNHIYFFSAKALIYYYNADEDFILYDSKESCRVGCTGAFEELVTLFSFKDSEGNVYQVRGIEEP